MTVASFLLKIESCEKELDYQLLVGTEMLGTWLGQQHGWRQGAAERVVAIGKLCSKAVCSTQAEQMTN